MPEALAELPSLPGLLLRAAGTLRRRGSRPLEPDGLAAAFRVPWPAPARQRAYATHFGGFRSALPLTWLYLPAQRAQLAVMLRPEFPFAVPGMVHTANELRRHAAVAPDSPIDLHVKVSRATAADEPGESRLVFDVSFEQAGRAIASCLSTYLTRAPRSPGRRNRRPRESLDGWRPMETWRLGSGTGLRYARLSGDFNPIHLHRWLSRWFGYRAPIAHGMYSVARSCASLEAELGAPLSGIDAVFRRPVVLPAAVQLLRRDEGAGRGAFLLASPDGRAIYVEGRYRSDRTVT